MFEDAYQKCTCGKPMIKANTSIIVCPHCGQFHIPRAVNVDKIIRDYKNYNEGIIPKGII